MTDTIKAEIRKFLTEKMIEKCSRLSSYYIVELSGDEEAIKTVNAAAFMESLFNGKGVPPKDASFIERHAKLFQEVQDYAKALSSL